MSDANRRTIVTDIDALTPSQRRVLAHVTFLANAGGGYAALHPESIRGTQGLPSRHAISEALQVLRDAGYVTRVTSVWDAGKRIDVYEVNEGNDDA